MDLVFVTELHVGYQGVAGVTTAKRVVWIAQEEGFDGYAVSLALLDSALVILDCGTGELVRFAEGHEMAVHPRFDRQALRSDLCGWGLHGFSAEIRLESLVYGARQQHRITLIEETKAQHIDQSRNSIGEDEASRIERVQWAEMSGHVGGNGLA